MDKKAKIDIWIKELNKNSSISNFISQSENEFTDARNQLLHNLEKYNRSTEITEEFVK